MRFKVNKSLPNIIRSSGSCRNLTSNSQFQNDTNRFSEIREKSLRKDNWNLFVGDTKYTTNFFMQFKDSFTKKLYDRHLIQSGLYSLRLILISMCILDYFV